jgi:hypothetical protein
MASVALAAAVWAAPAAAQGGREGEFSEAAIEQRKRELEDSFQRVQVEIDREFQDSVAFHARLKQERLDFERMRMTARKQLLDSLLGLPAAQRKGEFDRFHAEDSRRRKEFTQRVAQEKAVFRRQFLEERQDAKRQARTR